MAEFKISRLRFTWKGQWTTGVAYNRDAVVQFNGKTYVCLEPHTSGNFYDALYFIAPSGAATPYWTLLIDGHAWKTSWTPNTDYALGNIVRYGGIVYVCTVQHTSGPQVITSANWATYATFDNWNTAWTPTHVYGIGDVVKYGGIVYRCTVNHVSAATNIIGLEADQSKWEIVNNGWEYTGNYQVGRRYKLNDLVKNGPNQWKCLTGHVSTGAFSPSNWAIWMPGIEFTGTWSATTTYQTNDEVMYGGYSFISTIPNNLNSIPSSVSSDWAIATNGFKIANAWQSQAYKIGEVVRRSGQLFVAVQDNNGQDPTGFQATVTYTATGSTGTTLKVANTSSIAIGMIVNGVGFTQGQSVVSIFDSYTVILSQRPNGTPVDGQNLTFTGVNFAYWSLIVPGVSWGNFWTAGTTYVVGDLAIWASGTYRCVQNHSASALLPPSLDTTNSLWVPYALHARKNALSLQGDIVSYNNNATFALPIGTTDYTLRSTSNLPAWKQMFVTPGVYYVAPSGQDVPSPTYGTTWDRPWKSISYACAQVAAGMYFPNAKYLLSANKSFLITEMYNYMLYQSANNQTPFTSSSVFDQAKTLRDAGYAVDAIIYDMSRGGNSQSVANALAYFVPGTTDQFITAGVLSEINYFKSALNYLQNIVSRVLSNQSVTTNYQALNGLVSNFSTVATATDSILDQITVGNTSLMTVGQQIIFSGTSFGNLIDSTPYYILSIVDSTTITISATQGGQILQLLTRTGSMTAIGTGTKINQVINLSYAQEGTATTTASSLLSITINALTTQSTLNIPAPNQGLTATIMVKTGTYLETLPIVVPANVCVYGDELRGTAIQPKIRINTVVTSCDNALFTTANTTGLYDQCPVQFVGTTTFGGTPVFGGINAGQTYYVIGNTITSTQFGITDTLGGTIIGLTATASGYTRVVGGDAISDMFRMRNGTGLRNCTLTGLLGTLTAQNEFLTQRPTGGAFVALDPGTGPSDTSAWIIKRSPYAQNVSMFGEGCSGTKIDGTLHAGGNKSMVFNDFTTILSDGIGAWCKGSGALTELVSVFNYYGYAGYMAEDGGKIRATNGNSSYGTYGVIAEGYDVSETPISATVYNRSTQVTATVQSSFGTNAALLRLSYENAGSGYFNTTTNLIKQSNNFITTWATDGNLTLQQNVISPTTYSDGWTVTAATGGTDSSYFYQNTTINPTGAVYTTLQGSNVSGNGINCYFTITVNASSYAATIQGGITDLISGLLPTGGSGYVVGNQIKIFGSQVGGVDGVNDVIITVTSVGVTEVTGVSVTGTVPAGTMLNYTLSIHVKKGSASTVDLYGIFSGNSTTTSYASLNFNTGTVTVGSATGGMVPTQYGAISLSNGWYRIWMSVYDTNALNTSLQFRVYPRGIAGIPGYTYFYGAQLQISTTPTFYLSTTTIPYTSYSDYIVVGAGSGAIILGNETRSSSIFQTRLTDLTGKNGVGAGGTGHFTASNSSQGGSTTYIALAQSDTNTASNLVGLRVFVNSGVGAGQYGIISSYNTLTKYAQVIKDSFDPLPITASDSGTNSFSLSPSADVNTLYVNQPVQFIPTYFTTAISSTSKDKIAVTATTGGSINTLVTTNTARLKVNMPVIFTGAVFGGITSNYTYYISAILDGQTFRVTSTLFGNDQLLVNAVGNMDMYIESYTGYIEASTTNMTANMPIQFTGTTIGGLVSGTVYYVNDVISGSAFTVSSALVNVTVTATIASSDPTNPNQLVTSDTSSLFALNPIVFSGTPMGSILTGNKYYINRIFAGGTNFSVSSSLINVSISATTGGSNLITLNAGSSTTGFVSGNPIKFSGTAFGGLSNETTYYISAVNNASSFTVSSVSGGASVSLNTATGYMLARTTASATVLSTGSGSLFGVSTNAKTSLLPANGSLSGLFSTPIFGGIVQGTTYWIKTITTGSTNSFTLTPSDGGNTTVTLQTATGSMQMGWVGWDHVNLGTTPEPTLSSSTLYFVEPKLTYSSPNFTQVSATIPAQPVSKTYNSVGYGENLWVAVGGSNQLASSSSDGVTWAALSLPAAGDWTDVAYGNGYWIIMATNGSQTDTATKTLVSATNGLAWKAINLPSKTSWSSIEYGGGVFVAIASGTNTSAYSTNYGGSWSSGASLPNLTWTGLTWGKDKFVAVASGTTTAAYTTTGATWVSVTLPGSSAAWSSVAFGNGRFVAVASDGTKPVYSFDGITWIQSPYSVTASKIAYGQGVFVAINSGSTVAYTSEDGLFWKTRTVSPDVYTGIAFGFTSTVNNGLFVTVSGQSIGSNIVAGARAKGRPSIATGKITKISMWEPGSGYTSSIAPTISVFDPNLTNPATFELRKGNGALGGPTFVNRGVGYNATSTSITINGSGYKDQFQTGLPLTVNNLTLAPRPGDNLEIAGNSIIYKVTNVTVLNGSVAPNVTAIIQISPEMTTALTPTNGVAVSIRQKYSQVRLTGHDFLNIGFGNFIQSNYPGFPLDNEALNAADQAIETNYGRVFYSSTDQDGNFKVGSLFGVEQATGIVTLSASQFDLGGLDKLSLGGIAVGGSGVIISQFSTDQTFVANSNTIIPTQKAIKGYLTSRLSQGGANTFTGELTAGTVVVGGADKIRNTIPAGLPNSSVVMKNKVNFAGMGDQGGVDGNLMALDFFINTWHHRGNISR